VFGYSTPPHELRLAITARMQRLYDWTIDPGWIVFLPGVVPGLHLAARQLVARDGHALIPRPVYHHFKRALERAPRRFTELPLVLERGRWVFDLDAIDPGATALFLCNPQNPGGTVFRRAELEALAARTKDMLIVSDEIHCELILEKGLRHVPIASLDGEVSRRTVTLMSANKAFNIPAAGCGWAIIQDARLRASFSSEVASHVTGTPSVFGLAATLAALTKCDDWLAAQLDYLRANRDLVEREIGLPMAHVEATYLAWIDCSGVTNAAARFLERGVSVYGGEQFGEPGFVRLNFGTQRARLEEALKRIRSASTPSPRG
jgi:bifunctional pyridoxal-dependent enzyme with beta-cystathionase and maltose regulon repressor activities